VSAAGAFFSLLHPTATAAAIVTAMPLRHMCVLL
jgi:hypothetical protein